jgi:DnaJ family protein B protein 12
MDSNKDEAKKCYNFAKQHLETGRLDRAEKFIRKSLALFPTPEAEELLRRLESRRASYASGAENDMRNRFTSGSSSTRSSTDTSSSETHHGDGDRGYTDEQFEAVKRVQKCKDFYEILSVSKDVGDTELKKQYRRLALLLHPDKNKAPGAGEAFKSVGNAFAILSDVEKRKQYDLYGSEEATRASSPRGRRHGHGNNDFYSFEADITAEELFNMFFGGGFPSQNVYYYRRGQGMHSHAHHANRARTQARQEDNNAFSILFNLMPLLMLIFLTFIGNWFAADPIYSLTPTSKYMHERFTSNHKFPYYVKSDFDDTYKGSLKQLERNVEEDYIATLRHTCFKERNYKETLMWQARTYGDPVRLKRAQEMETPACRKLTQIYG